MPGVWPFWGKLNRWADRTLRQRENGAQLPEVAAFTAASLPYGRLFAAGGSDVSALGLDGRQPTLTRCRPYRIFVQ